MAVACEGQLDAIVGEANLSDSAADISERHGVYERLANLGVPLPKHVQEPSTEQHISETPRSSARKGVCCFGIALESSTHWQAVVLNSGESASLPGFLVALVSYLEDHLASEGLFRKAGSLQKQRILRTTICNDRNTSAEEVSEYDVASLLKQYFRLLPGGLIPQDWKECLLPVVERYEDTPTQLSDMVIDICFLLPKLNLSALQYVCCLLNRIAEVSSTMSSDRLAVVLAPSILQCSAASDNDMNHCTQLLQVLIENANDLGTTSLPDESAERMDRPFAMTPTTHYQTPPVLSPTTELKSLRYKHTLQSAAPSPGRIILGKCVDSRLMEICSSNESLASKSCQQSPEVVREKEPSVEEEGNAEKKRKKRKRRSSISGLVNSIGQTFERFKATKISGHGLENGDGASAKDSDAPATVVRKPKLATPLRNLAVSRRQSLPRDAKSKAKRGKMAAVHRVPSAKPALPPQKRKAESEDTQLLSPQKRKVMLQSLAIQDLEIKHASNSRLSKLPTQPQTPCMTHSASGPGPLAALQPVSVRSRSSSDGSSIKGIQASASIQVLYDRSGSKENLAPRQTSSLKRESACRSSSLSLHLPTGTRTSHLDSDVAMAKALMHEPKIKTRLRRLSGGLLKKNDANDKVAHIMEVGERLANLRPNSSSHGASVHTTPTHIRWRAPPGTLPPTNSPSAFPCTLPTASASFLGEPLDKQMKHLSLPPESPLTGYV